MWAFVTSSVSVFDWSGDTDKINVGLYDKIVIKNKIT